MKIENNTFRDNLLVKLDKLIELNTKNNVLETEFNKLVTKNDEISVKQDEIEEIKSNDENNKKIEFDNEKTFVNIKCNQILISTLFFVAIILYLALQLFYI